jgi:hypothetical protein
VYCRECLYVPGVTWILGSSLVVWASREPQVLKLAAESSQSRVFWCGMRGGRLIDCEQLLQAAVKNFPKPDTIIIHLGGNDIGTSSIKFCLGRIQDMPCLVAKYAPQACLVWSDILPRRCYRNIDIIPAENMRQRLNLFARSLSPYILALKHGVFKNTPDNLYKQDGVHLSTLGSVHFATKLLQTSVQTAVITRCLPLDQWVNIKICL